MSMRRRAFTLIEIMIVVLIIGILLTIAVPQWIKAREGARSKSCLSNLKKIEGAKEQWAMEYKMPSGSPVVEADIYPEYLKGSAFPTCAGGGTYALGLVGEQPTCSQHGTN
jgi:prepilin-type N-terminal cleavage/methylation domain-containing protein